jgi:endonuclease YncB( thermonuclease family)
MPKLISSLWWYPAQADPHAYYDGDTLGSARSGGVRIDLGFYTSLGPVTIRFLGIDAPELGTPEGEAAKAFLGEQLDAHDWRVVLRCESGRPHETFGRYLAHVYLPDGTDLSQLMLTSGHAVPDPGP